MNSFYTEKELKEIGFKSIGTNVLISRKSSIYSPQTIQIGNNVRIDDFCILSGDISIGNYVHIAAYCGLYGKFGIEMQDYSGLSIRCTLLSASDDFSGDFLVGPTIEPNRTNISGGKITLKKYVTIGLNSIVFPNITIGEGTAVGAMSLINKDLEEWGIYVGIPAKRKVDREKGLLKLV
ncbi:galactoside O-acetyltransferase [Bacteroidia bacterium]|nr:galactoside O-acetyltransferase [Bacteroidia bacterium]